MKSKILFISLLFVFVFSSFVFAYESNFDDDRDLYTDYNNFIDTETDTIDDVLNYVELNNDVYVVLYNGYTNDIVYYIFDNKPDDLGNYTTSLGKWIKMYDTNYLQMTSYKKNVDGSISASRTYNTDYEYIGDVDSPKYYYFLIDDEYDKYHVSTNNAEVYSYLLENFDNSHVTAFEGTLPDIVSEPSYDSKLYFYDLYSNDFEIWEVSSYFIDTLGEKHIKKGLVATNNMSGNATTLYRDSQSVSHFLACDDSQISYYYNYIWYANATDMSDGYPTQWSPNTDGDFNQPTSVWFEYNDIRVESVLDDDNNKTFTIKGYVDDTMVNYDISSNYSITNLIDNNIIGSIGTDINLSFDVDLSTSSNSDIYFIFNGNQIRLNFTDFMGNSGQSTNGNYDNNIYGDGITGTIKYIKDIIVTFLVAVVDIFTALINQIKSFAFVLSYAFESFPPVILSIIIFGFAMSVFKMVRG